MKNGDWYASEVERTVRRTANTESNTLLLALGLLGEAGEVGEIVKKSVRDGKELSAEKLVEEVGDVLWYLQALLNQCDTSIADCMAANATKLRKRYPEKFTADGGVR